MDRARLHFLFLNLGHFFDHFFLLIFATAAALTLTRDWGMSYAELIPYATPGFVAYAVCSIPAGWLGDRWSREGMMSIFFIGIGLSSMATALAETPLQIAAGLFAIGVFAAIYHPVGLALVIAWKARSGMPIAINGVYGNLGVASAALITGFLIDTTGWRGAFIWPGVVSVVLGIAYAVMIAPGGAHRERTARASEAASAPPVYDKRFLLRVFAIIFFATALGGLIFQSTTFALPKLFEERLQSLAGSATEIGWYAFIVFAVAAVGQLIVGHLVDRYPIRYIFALVAGIQAVLLGAMPGLTGWSAVLVSVAFMFAVFGQIPINDVLVGRVTRSEWRSRVLAARYIVTFSVTAISVPVIAWIHGGWGFDMLFAVLAIAAGAIFLAVIMLPARMAAPAVAE